MGFIRLFVPYASFYFSVDKNPSKFFLVFGLIITHRDRTQEVHTFLLMRRSGHGISFLRYSMGSVEGKGFEFYMQRSVVAFSTNTSLKP